MRRRAVQLDTERPTSNEDSEVLINYCEWEDGASDRFAQQVLCTRHVTRHPIADVSCVPCMRKASEPRNTRLPPAAVENIKLMSSCQSSVSTVRRGGAFLPVIPVPFFTPPGVGGPVAPCAVWCPPKHARRRIQPRPPAAAAMAGLQQVSPAGALIGAATAFQESV